MPWVGNLDGLYCHQPPPQQNGQHPVLPGGTKTRTGAALTSSVVPRHDGPDGDRSTSPPGSHRGAIGHPLLSDPRRVEGVSPNHAGSPWAQCPMGMSLPGPSGGGGQHLVLGNPPPPGRGGRLLVVGPSLRAGRPWGGRSLRVVGLVSYALKEVLQDARQVM